MEQKTNELLYNALMLGRNKLVEKEEYLTATGNKQAADFNCARTTVNIIDIFEDAQAGISLTLLAPGYLEIRVSCEDDFIELSSQVITSDKFDEKNHFIFRFTIKASKLHVGKNFTEIVFMTAMKQISIPVVVNNRIRTNLGGGNVSRIRCELVQRYLELRMNKISKDEWAAKSYTLVANVGGNDSLSLFFMLFKARLQIYEKDYSAAKNLIDYVAEEERKRSAGKTQEALSDLECYLIYVISLYQADDFSKKQALLKIEEAFSMDPTWQKLWMIFRLDKTYDVERGKKLNRIQSLYYYQHETSPIIYLEALEVFLRRPELLGAVTDFEVQVIYFAVKYDRAKASLIGRLADIVNEMPEAELAIKNNALLSEILKAGYNKYSANNILKALCRILVYTQTNDPADNIYFEKAIGQFLDVENLNIYYIFTVDRSKMNPIPDSVVEYFFEHSDELLEYRSYFYANIIANKRRNSEHYRHLLKLIVAFAEEQLKKGIIDEYMAVIYEDILEADIVSHMMEDDIFDVICTRRIVCRNPRMERVIVIHKELSVYQEVVLASGSAMVQVYSHDAIILFKDVTGNIFVNVDYDMYEFVNRGEYIDLCIKAVPINIHMLMDDIFPLVRNYKPAVPVLKFMAENLGKGRLRAEYERILLRDTLAYYKKHTNDEAIYDALLEFLKFRLDSESRALLIEIMIERTMFRVAFEEIEKNGIEGVGVKEITRLCAVLTTLPEYADNALLLDLCEKSFIADDEHNPDVFNYLENYYDKDIDVLIRMYHAANAYGHDSLIPAERIIRKSIELRAVPAEVPKIFSDYCDKNDADEDLKIAYPEFRAAEYMKGNISGDKTFFARVERGDAYRFSDCVYAAYLLYMSERPEAALHQDLIKDFLYALCDRAIMLEEFKNFSQYFEIPPALQNTHIACVRTDSAEGAPKISYCIMGRGQSVNHEEPMTEIFSGCFVRYFNLFKGDVLTYTTEDGKEGLASYDGMNVVRDGSRYSRLDELISLQTDDDVIKYKTAVRDFYVRDKMTEGLF